MTLESQDNKKCPSCLAGFSKEDIAGNCTCDTQDNKTTDCCATCFERVKASYSNGITNTFNRCSNPQCECHTPATDDLVETETKMLMQEVIPEYSKVAVSNEDRVDGYEMLPLENWLRSKLNEVISRTREEAYKEGFEFGMDRNFQEDGKQKAYDRGKEQGIREERERVEKQMDTL